VDDDIMASDTTGVVRGAMGLAFVDDTWWPVERVAEPEFFQWRQAIQSGPGRDERLAGDVRDRAGRRHLSLHEYLGMLREVDHSDRKDWPHPGPSAALETLVSVRGSNMELIPYDAHWAKHSGVSQSSAIRCEHRTIFHALALFQQIDQIDLPATAGGEYLCRRGIQLQRAVRVCPRAPDFTGLHKMIEHALDESGGVQTRSFTQHFAQEAEAEARILKQNRLYRVELGSSQQRGNVDDSDDGVPQLTAKQKKALAKANAGERSQAGKAGGGKGQ
jgi:hypothetical protein